MRDMMKKRKLVIPALLMVLCLSACGSKTESESQTAGSTTVSETAASTEAAGTTESTETADSTEDTETTETASQAEEGTTAAQGTLVVYFSATGTTKGVAERIASVTNADLYEIVPVEPYSDADLNWHDDNCRANREQNDKSFRPEIASEDISLEGYSTVFIGFPIWWGEEPRIMDAFVEKYDFSGITLIPFCTSGSSGIGQSGENLEACAGSGTWLAGERFSGSVSEEDLTTWIDELQREKKMNHFF